MVNKQLTITINLPEEDAFNIYYKGDALPLCAIVMWAYPASYLDSFSIIAGENVSVNGYIVTDGHYQVQSTDVVYMGVKQVRWEEL